MSGPRRSKRVPELTDTQAIRHFWHPSSEIKVVNIAPGGCYITDLDEMLSAVLGSCISACIRDPDAGVGGMNHFMLPYSGSAQTHSTTLSQERYGSYAMECLINQLLRLGADKRRMEVKIFGGANVLGIGDDIGDRNIAFIHEYLETEGLSVSSEDIGGHSPRKVRYFPYSGKVRLKRLPTTQVDDVRASESAYAEKINTRKQTGTVELFDSWEKPSRKTP